MLAREAERAKVDWALVLGDPPGPRVRQGTMGFRPVRTTAVRLAELSEPGARLRARSRATAAAEFADQALALRDYNRAVGLRALVVGLEPRSRGCAQALRDKSVAVYQVGASTWPSAASTCA